MDEFDEDDSTVGGDYDCTPGYAMKYGGNLGSPSSVQGADRQGAGPTSQYPAGSSEAKYLDTLRKLRAVTVKYESEKTRVSKLSQRVVALEREKEDALNPTPSEVTLPSQRRNNNNGTAISDQSEVDEYKRDADRANKSMVALRRQNDELKSQVLKLKKTIISEVGSEVAENDEGWRGRSQQIALLKMKVKELERMLNNGEQRTMNVTSVSSKDYDEENRLALERHEVARRTETRELFATLQAKDNDIGKEKQRGDGLAARLQVLERDNQHLKVCIRRVIEKTENDDKLIEAYKAEIDDFRRAKTAQPTSHADRRNDEIIGEQRSTIQQLRAENESLLQQRNRQTTASVAHSRVAIDPMGPAPSVGELLLVVEVQRSGILALEAQLARPQIQNRSEETLNLKERLRVMSDVMESEIAMYKSLATTAKPSSTPSGPRPASENADYAALKQQYDELRRAYNAEMRKQMK